MFPKFTDNSKGQALVEFALILVVLLLFIFIIIESGRLFQGYLTVQNAARAAGRYAMTGQFATDCLFETPACLDARLTSIKRESRRAGSGLAIDDLAVAGERNSFYTEVWSYNTAGEWLQDETGGSGDPIDIIVRFQMPVVTPLLRPLADSIRLTGRVKVVAENFDQVGTTENSAAPPAPGTPPGGSEPPEADLSILKVPSDSVVVVGDPLNYTLTISNAGPFDAEETITVVDTLPEGSTYLTYTEGTRPVSCVENPPLTITCVMPNLDKDPGPQNSASVTLQTLAPMDPDVISNTATVYPGVTTVDPDWSNNTTTATVTVRANYADLSVAITDDPDPVSEGGTLTYTLNVSNRNWEDAHNVVLTATLSSDVTLDPITPVDPAGTCSVVGPFLVRCDIPFLLLNDNFEARILVTANDLDDALLPRFITVTATVSADEFDPDLTYNNAEEETAIAAAFSDLVLRKIGPSGPVPSKIDFVYTLIITNTGPDAVDTSTIVDTLPDTVTYTGIYTPSTGGISCGLGASNTVTCNMGALSDPSDPVSSTKSVQLRVYPNIADNLFNEATVTGSLYDPNINNNTDSINTSVGQANLTIKKYAPFSVEANDPLTYTLVVTNNGLDLAPNVIVVDDLPPNLSMVSASSMFCQPTGAAQYTCDAGDLLPGEKFTAIITGIAPDEDLIVNRARTYHQFPDLNDADNSVVVTTTTTLVADLELFKFDETDYDRLGNEGLTGEQLRYLIQLGSRGPSPAYGLKITDTLPAEVEFASVTPSNICSHVDSTHQVVCDLGGLVLGPTISIRINVTPTLPGLITNTAVVTGPQVDYNLSNNVTYESIEILPADLEISKFATASALVSDTITYTLVVSSVGPSTAHEVVITDTLPVSVTSPTAVASVGSCDASGNPVVCTVDELAVGETMIVTISATAVSDGVVVNEASTRAKDTVEVDVAQATTLVSPVTDLAIGKTASGVFYAGEPLTYTLTITNHGPSIARSVRVTDTLPANIEYLGPVTCSEGGGVVNCTIDMIPIGATRTVTLSTRTLIHGDFVNFAQVGSAAYDPESLNNSTTITTTILPAADLGITKTHSGLFFAGEAFTYTIAVFNEGPSLATALVVTDTLPSDVNYLGVVSPGPACLHDSFTNVLECPLGDLGAGSTASFQIRVSTDITGYHTNNAEAQSATADLHQDDLSNTTSLVTFIRPVANLTIEKGNAAGAPLPAVAGTQHTYAITVTNDGPNVATGVVVTDVLPAGMSYASDTNVTPCEDLGSVISCTLGTLDPLTPTSFEITVDILPSAGAGGGETLTNVAFVEANEADRDGNGNRAEAFTDVIRQVDLTIDKSDDGTDAVAGGFYTYTIKVTNNGPSDAGGVIVTDTLPLGTGYARSSGNVTCPDTSSPILCQLLPDLANGESFTFTVTIALASSLQETALGGDPLENTAYVSSDEQELPGDPNSDTEYTDVVRWTDLAIEKLDMGRPAVVGEYYTYTLNVVNNGPSDATGVTVDDDLPSGIDAVIFPPACTGDVGNITCDLGALADGEMASITIEVLVGNTVGDGDLLTNSVVVDGNEPIDPDPTNDDDVVVTPVRGKAELSIAKDDLDDPVTAGAELGYEITIFNDGPSTASGIVVTDTLPAGMTYITSTVPCSGSGQTWYCTPPSIGNGLQSSFIITVEVSSSVGQGVTVTNWAEVGAVQVERDRSDNLASEVTTIEREAELWINKTDTGEPAKAGGVYTYTIDVTNDGLSDASGVTVTDTLPSGVVYRSSTDSICEILPSVGADRVCLIGDLAAGATRSFTISVNVDAGIASGDTLVNEVIVAGNEADPGARPNFDQTTTNVVREADLSVTKMDEGVNAIVDRDYTYDIVVNNAGPSGASEVVVTDTIPLSTTFVSASSGCSSAGRVVTCTLASVPVGVPQPLTVTVHLGTELNHDDSIENVVIVKGLEPDPDDSDNDDSVVTLVTGNADLQVSKWDWDNVAIAGEQFVYTVTVSNPSGPTDASGVVVTDTLPAEMTFPSPGGLCAPQGSEVRCNVGDLGVGLSASFRITVSVASGASGGNVDNVVRVKGDQFDGVQSNNTFTETTLIAREADLSITKSGAATAAAGALYTYTIRVDNDGPSDATSNVTVTDTLPSDAQLVRWSGADCSAIGQDMTCGLTGGVNALDFVEFTITISTTSSLDDGVILVNKAGVFADESDPGPGLNYTTFPTTVNREVDLQLKKVGQSSTATVGEPFTYTLWVTNTGPSDASNIVVTDTLPISTTYQDSSITCNPSVGLDPEERYCVVGDLAAGEAMTFTLQLRVDPYVAHNVQIFNEAVAGGDEFEHPDNLADNTAVEQTRVIREIDLQIDKSDDGSDARAGGFYTYTVTFTNTGPSDASSVTVTDTLPAHSQFAWATGTTTATCTSSALEYACDFGTVANNETRTFSVTVEFLSSAPHMEVVTNTVEISANETDIGPGNIDKEETTVVRVSDLTVSKEGIGLTATAGDLYTYEITVSNIGDSDASGVVVTDTLPVSMTYDSAVGATCNPIAGTRDVRCDVSDVPAGGAPVTFQFTVNVSSTVTEGEVLTNQVVVKGNEDESDNGNNDDSVNTAVSRESELRISKSPVNDAVAGTVLTYTITLENLGPSDASGITITDTLPQQSSFHFSSGCGLDNGEYVCDVGDLASGDTEVISFAVLLDADIAADTLITNTVTVDGNEFDPGNWPNVAEAETVVSREADMAIGKAGLGAFAIAGEPYTYTLTVTNTGPSEASGVVVTDNLPAGTEYLSSTPGCSDAGGVLTCNLSDLGVDSTHRITITVGVTSSLAHGITITNQASVTSDETDNNGDNNTASVDTAVERRVDVEIEKNGLPGTAVAGESLQYTVVVRNNGPSDAANVIFTDTLPISVTLPSQVADCTWPVSGGQFSCTIPTLPAGTDSTYNFSVDVIADAISGTTLINFVEVSTDDIDDSTTDDTSQVTTPIIREADMAIGKLGPASTLAGQTMTYTLVVTNNGPSLAGSVFVSDTLPAMLGSVVITPTGGFVCPPSGLLVNCSLDEMAPGDSATITIQARPSMDGVITNTATVEAAVVDSPIANNEATMVTTVDPAANLSIFIPDGIIPVPNKNVTFTIELRINNFGPSIARDVMVTETLEIPANKIGDLVFHDALSYAGCTLNPGTAIVTCDLPDLNPGQFMSIDLVFEFTNIGSLLFEHHTAVITSSTQDPVPANNFSDGYLEIG